MNYININYILTTSCYLPNTGWDYPCWSRSLRWSLQTENKPQLSLVVSQIFSQHLFILNIKFQTWTARVIFSCLSKVDKQSPKFITWWLLSIIMINRKIFSDNSDNVPSEKTKVISKKITHPFVNCFWSCEVNHLKDFRLIQ